MQGEKTPVESRQSIKEFADLASSEWQVLPPRKYSDIKTDKISTLDNAEKTRNVATREITEEQKLDTEEPETAEQPLEPDLLKLKNLRTSWHKKQNKESLIHSKEPLVLSNNGMIDVNFKQT